MSFAASSATGGFRLTSPRSKRRSQAVKVAPFVDYKKQVQQQVHDDDDNDEISSWLGSESTILGLKLEKRGIREMLKIFSEEEKEEIILLDDKSMLIRYLRANKGNVERSIEKIRETIQWRKDFFVHYIINCIPPKVTDTAIVSTIRAGLIEEYKSGVLYIRGYTKDGRAIINCHIDNGNFNSGKNNEVQQYRALVHLLEKAIACTKRKSQELNPGKPPLEKFIFVVDFTGYSNNNNRSNNNNKASSTTSFRSVARGCNNIFSNHYPERLDKVYLINPPFIFRTVYRFIKPFIDPITRDKFIFCNNNKIIEQQFISIVENSNKIEHVLCSCNNNKNNDNNNNVRPFNSTEYLNLPWDVGFDE